MHIKPLDRQVGTAVVVLQGVVDFKVVVVGHGVVVVGTVVGGLVVGGLVVTTVVWVEQGVVNKGVVVAARVVVGKAVVGVVVGDGVVVLQTQQTSLVHIPSGHFVTPNAPLKDGAQPSPSGH